MSPAGNLIKREAPTILIVDDSSESISLMVGLLDDEYKIKVAKSGEKALELLSKSPLPDVILLDVIMPGLNGHDVGRQLKQDQRTEHIPVIFLTALNDSENEAKGFELGAADYISKPFNPTIFKARIKTQMALVQEKKKTQHLLENFLPKKVIQNLVNSGASTPEHVANISLIFCDLVGFTKITEQLSKEELLDELSEIFSTFDVVMDAFGGQRLKTVGDAYIGSIGMQSAVSDHADKAVNAALDMIDQLAIRNTNGGPEWKIRVGIHSGSVIAGIVGKSRYQYDIFGDDVNMAARVESVSSPMKVTISDQTRALLQDPHFVIEPRGKIDLKGKGERELFFVGR